MVRERREQECVPGCLQTASVARYTNPINTILQLWLPLYLWMVQSKLLKGSDGAGLQRTVRNHMQEVIRAVQVAVKGFKWGVE